MNPGLDEQELADIQARSRAALSENDPGSAVYARAASLISASTEVLTTENGNLIAATADGAPADLVMRAARRWSPANHELFPDAARARAVDLLLLGHLLSRESQFEGAAQAVVDIWLAGVMPMAVERSEEEAVTLERLRTPTL